MAQNGNEWIKDPAKRKAMDAIDAKAKVLYTQLESIAREFEKLKKEQVGMGFYFEDYSYVAAKIREISGIH